MAEAGDNSIIIPIGYETTAAAEQLAELQALQDEAFSRGLSTAIDKAQVKIDELTAAQRRLAEVTANNGVVIAELESRRSSADAAELSRIDQQIAKLQQLNQQHGIETQTMEAKKVAIGANSLALLAATDAERAAIREGVQAQLISIQTLRDQDRAYNAVRDTAVASQQAIRAQLDSVIAKQGEVQASIVQQGEAYEVIAANRANQPEGEQAQTDAILTSLQRVINARMNENLALDAKRIRLEADASTAQATSDAERTAIHATTQARLQQLTVELDQQKVNQGVRDSWTAASDRQREAIAKVTADEQRLTAIILEQQGLVQAMRGQRPDVPEGQQPTVDSEVAARQRVIDQHIQELAIVQQKRVALEAEAATAAATSDTERANIQATAEAQRRTIQLQADEQRAVSRTRDVYAQSLTATTRQVQELNVQQARNDTVIQANTARIRELQAARESASAHDREAYTAEITSLERTTQQRQADNARIEEKRLLLGETTALATAGSEEERNAIREVTAARLAELSIQRDQVAAQAGLTAEVEGGIPIVGQFVSMFTGLGGAMFALQEIKQVLAEDLSIMQAAIAAGEKLRGEAAGQADVAKKFNDEMGLQSAPERQTGTNSLNAIATAYQLPQQVVGDTGAALAATLRREATEQNRPDIGDVNSRQFQDLVGNAALFVNRGVEASNMSFFVQEKLKQNPAMTGAQLNQELSNFLADANGSPQLMNEGLSIMSQDSARYTEAGFAPDALQNVFRRAAQVAPAAEVPGLVRQYGQGVDRLLGLKPRDMIELAEKVNGLTPMQESLIKEMSQAVPDDKLGGVMKQIERMRRPGTGMPVLDREFEHGVQTGKIDAPAFMADVGGLDANARQVVARQVAGPRNVVAVGSLLDTGGMPAKAAPLMPTPSSPVETTRVAQEQADAAAAAARQPDPYEAVFATQVDRESTYVERNADSMKSWAELYPSIGRIANMGPVADTKEVAAGRVLTRKLVELGRIREQMRTGQIKYTQKQADDLQNSINSIMDILQQRGQQSEPLIALASGAVAHVDPDTGKDVTTTAAQSLASYDADPEKFLRTQLNLNVLATHDDAATDDRTAGAALRDADAAERSLRGLPPPPPRVQPTQPVGPPRPTPSTAPTTRPAPTPYREPTTDREVGGTTPIPQPTPTQVQQRAAPTTHATPALRTQGPVVLPRPTQVSVVQPAALPVQAPARQPAEQPPVPLPAPQPAIQGPQVAPQPTVPQPAAPAPTAQPQVAPAHAHQPAQQPTTKPSGPPVSINYHIRQTNYGYSSDSLGAPANFDTNYG